MHGHYKKAKTDFFYLHTSVQLQYAELGISKFVACHYCHVVTDHYIMNYEQTLLK